MRERRAAYDGPRGEAAIVKLLREHARHANAVADDTLAAAKAAMRLDLGPAPAPATAHGARPGGARTRL